MYSYPAQCTYIVKNNSVYCNNDFFYKGEFGLVYQSYLTGWEGRRTAEVVAVKTLKSSQRIARVEPPNNKHTWEPTLRPLIQRGALLEVVLYRVHIQRYLCRLSFVERRLFCIQCLRLSFVERFVFFRVSVGDTAPHWTSLHTDDQEQTVYKDTSMLMGLLGRDSRDSL